MKASPVVSVIIPVYNVEKYLPRCLDSVLGQSCRNIEVICVDDGSTDSSPEILQRYADRDDRVRVLTQKNLGVSAARNAGIAVATGKWVAFVDSDDEVMPNIWETLLAEADTEDVIFFEAEEIVFQNGKPMVIQSGYFNVKFKNRRKLRDSDLFFLSMTVWDKLFRRSKIEEYGIHFPHGVVFEDNAFVLSFIGINRLARFVPKKLYRYFRHEGSITSNALRHKPGLAFDYIKILNFLHEEWLKQGLFPQMEASFEEICFSKFRSAIEICQPWERAGIAYVMASSLHRWGLNPRTEILRALKEGSLRIRIGSFPGKDITLLKPLRGWQKLFYIGNWQGRRILCVFGCKLASWKRPDRI